jgi:hypothetical protein
MQAVIQLAQQHGVIAHRFYGAEGKVRRPARGSSR